MPKTLTHEDLMAKAGPLSQEELAGMDALLARGELSFRRTDLSAR